MFKSLLPAAGLYLLLTPHIAFAAGFTLISNELSTGHFDRAQLSGKAVGFGCDGENRSPSLNGSGAPAGTKSFALRIYNLDAPTGVGWVHWQVINIPASTNSLPGNITRTDRGLPARSVQTHTDFGMPALRANSSL